MATKFKLKRSTVGGVTPTTGDIDVAELAVNLVDRKLFTSNGSAVFELGSNLTNLSVTGNTTIVGLIANGSLGTSGQVLTSNGTGAYWSNSTSSIVINEQFIANGTANSFTITGGYTPSAIEVYVAGVKQVPVDDVDISSGTTVDFVTPPLADQIVDVFGFLASIEASGVTSIASGNGLTGGPITTTGTLSVLPNTGIIANSTGLFVNSAYINTISSNSAAYANASISNTFTVGTGTYFVANGNVGIGNTTPADKLRVEGNVSISGGIVANGSLGTSGQVLHSNGTSIYWDTDDSGGAGVNTDAQYVWANTHIFNDNVTTNSTLIISKGLQANGSLGTSGQVLHSNGTSIYWDTDDQGVTSIVSGDGLTSGTITSTGTLSVLANSGIVSNSTGVFVNTSYIATLSANDSSFLGGVAAASYVQNTDSRTLSGNLVISGTYFNPSSNTILLGNTTARWVISANSIDSTGDIVTTANITSNGITTGYLTVDHDLLVQGNLTVYGSSISLQGNTITFSDNKLYLNQGILATITNITSNGTHVTFVANNNFQTGWDVFVSGVDPSSYNGNYTDIFSANATHFVVANTNTDSYVSGGTARGKTDQNPDIGIAAGYNDGTYHHTGIFRDASDGYWKVFDNYGPEPDAAINIDTSDSTFRIANFWTDTIRVGNTTVYATINSTSYSGSANDASSLGGVAAASYVNTSGSYTISGVHTHNANLVIGSTAGIVANGSLGTSGQVLHSNGTSIYWDTDDPGGAGVNTAAEYVWTNNHVFNANITANATLILDSSVNLDTEATTLATISQSQIASFAAASYRSCKYVVQIYDSVSGEVQISEILLAHNGTTASATEYGVVHTGTSPLVTFDVDINSGNVRLLATRTTTNSTQYKVFETLMVA